MMNEVQGGLGLVAVRAAFVAALLSLFGTLLFQAWVMPRATFAMQPAELLRGQSNLRFVGLASAAACLIFLLAWLTAQTAFMADAENFSETFAALGRVLTRTVFGTLVCLQTALLAATAAAAWRTTPWRTRGATGLAAASVLVQAGHSHAFAMQAGLSFLLAADALHLLAAGAWLGALLPLVTVILTVSPRAGAACARWFSPLGKFCVAVIAATALFQGWVLVASVPGLIGTLYGWVVLLKLAFFAILLLFACLNRYRFAPALRGPAPGAARATLIRSLLLQTGSGITIIAVAALLSQLEPSMHSQPWWPFAQRFSWSAAAEDPDIGRDILVSAFAFTAGLAMLAAAFVLRRYRLPAVALALMAASLCALCAPRFSVLLVDAYPTSFYHSPTGFAAASILNGQRLFAANCTACHGANGQGDGPLAKPFSIALADLTAPHLWMHSDGELFWWLAHGIDSPEGGVTMPGFAAGLDDDSRWALIDYIRAHNAGVAAAGRDAWPHPIHAPRVAITCNHREMSFSDMEGQFLRLWPGGDSPTATGSAAPICTSQDPTAVPAYAIVSGLPPDITARTEFLIDPEGWLIASQPRHIRDGWDNPKILAERLARASKQKPHPRDMTLMPRMPM